MMPWLNQLVIMCQLNPEPSNRSPSLVMIGREHTRFLRLARINCQSIAIGVRDIMLPPMPSDSPSRTRPAASSRDIVFE